MKNFLVICMVLLFCPVVYADPTDIPASGDINTISTTSHDDCEAYTVADTAIGINYPVSVSKTISAICCVETAQVRYMSDDDASPTSAIGIILNVNDCKPLESYTEIKNFKVIRTGSTSATMNCCIHYE